MHAAHNWFFKKLENLQAAAAVHVAYYNYCWVPKTIQTTPAVKAGIAQQRMRFIDLYQLLREMSPDLFFDELRN